MRRVPPVHREQRGERPWAAAARIAQARGRCVTLGELTTCGISPNQVTRAARAGLVTRVHRGVYALGPPRLSPDERLWAAYLAAGPGAVVSHNSARALLGIRPWTGPPHITAPTRKRPLRGVFLHIGSFSSAETGCGQVASRRGRRCTAPARTLADCALVTDHTALMDDIDMAIGNELITFAELEASLATMPGHNGLRRLACALAELADDPGAGRTHGEMELIFKRKFRALTHLPAYLRNHRLTLPDGRVVVPDVYFPGERVWIELDSRRWHEQRRAMDSDRRRDQRAMALGYLTFRITWRQLLREWTPVSADLQATVALRAPA